MLSFLPELKYSQIRPALVLKDFDIYDELTHVSAKFQVLLLSLNCR